MVRHAQEAVAMGKTGHSLMLLPVSAGWAQSERMDNAADRSNLSYLAEAQIESFPVWSGRVRRHETSRQRDTQDGYRAFGCGLLHRGNRSECWVVTRGDSVRPDELYQSSYGAVHAELLTRYERVGASRGTQVWCRDMEPFVIRFRTCRVSKLVRYQEGDASVNYLNKPLHDVSDKLSEGRLEFAKESSRNAMTVKCTNFPDFWVRKASLCKVANARLARAAGLATREPLRRILNDLSAGRLVKRVYVSLGA
ncbi:hypothetical protein E2C01_015944 [Portunus trituberculatus]|uniref:Uncharacterized protein n=1 Tax=Portunus trituberculatus TaxID=210409 RepID=A0A5B7DPQ8_PORTR|nr:hypothetical protein [Portunus trituberculatus]